MATKGMAVKLSVEIVELARGEAETMKRSISGQLEYWAELGRMVEEEAPWLGPLIRAAATGKGHGALEPAEIEKWAVATPRVLAALKGKGSVHEFESGETESYLNLLGNELERLDGSDARRIRRLERAGHPIAGEDKNGKLVVRK